jgi:hypothetical protein
MYSVINRFQQTIISDIDPQYVKQYEWILQNVAQADSADYHQQYRGFWGMNVARLSSGFYATYFGLLKAPTPTLTLASLCDTLYDSSTRDRGKQTLQFSLATKLLHILNPHLPIYDSRVARFYLFKAPTSGSVKERAEKLTAFHNFLVAEYARVINNSLLAPGIVAFRERFRPQQPHGREDCRFVDLGAGGTG